MSRTKKRRRRRFDEGEAEVPMTAMIDVVFLLLIYFVMTMEPIPIFAHLQVLAPASDAPPPEAPKDPPSLIRIGVTAEGLTFDGVPVSDIQLDGFLRMLAKASTSQSVLIVCASDSRHGNLVNVLDLCAKYGLANLSVVSGGA